MGERTELGETSARSLGRTKDLKGRGGVYRFEESGAELVWWQLPGTHRASASVVRLLGMHCVDGRGSVLLLWFPILPAPNTSLLWAVTFLSDPDPC